MSDTAPREASTPSPWTAPSPIAVIFINVLGFARKVAAAFVARFLGGLVSPSGTAILLALSSAARRAPPRNVWGHEL